MNLKRVMNRMNRAALLAAALLIAAGTANAQKSKAGNAMKPVADKSFFTKAAEGGMAEVEFGQLAAK